ncbi:MAG: 1-phosphofructokinase family hexose kinase, partial [Phycisphaerae bacterium]|nr:1-phosphofructokinase family hexose kinase [Phycisphaerae bacterium]
MTNLHDTPAHNAPIVTVSLNPVFDLILEVENFQIGRHQLGQELQLLPAGKGLNVCRTLDSLGLSSIITGFVGQESMADFEQPLADTDITAQFFVLPGRTRQNVTIVDPSQLSDTHIRQRGLKVTGQDLERMGKKLGLLAEKDRVMVFAGSLPPGVSPAGLARLLRICKQDGARTVVDTSGQALAAVVKEGAWLIKPNRQEFACLTGRTDQKIEQIARSARRLTNQVHNILISLGEEGALLIARNSAIRARIEPTKPTKMLNTVGSGDALLGAFLAGIVQGRDMQTSLIRALAVSWAACQTPSPASFDARLARKVQS